MIFKVMRNKKPLILGIVLSILMITALSVFKYADKMYREYNNTPLTLEIIQKELALMTTGAVLPNGNWSYGIDISHHQPLVRWKKLRILIDEDGKTVWSQKKAVRTESIDYVFMKATEGESFKDWRFKGRWRKAKKYGITRGAYHFFRPGKSAESQAQNFINSVGVLESTDLPPVLDIEKMDDCSVETLNNRALEWLKIVEKHYGRKPIVYANPYYLKNIIDNRITSNYPIWVANYNVKRPSYGNWRYWQFTDKGLVRGIGPVDINIKRE